VPRHGVPIERGRAGELVGASVVRAARVGERAGGDGGDVAHVHERAAAVGRGPRAT
jgi:hypothetical protein